MAQEEWIEKFSKLEVNSTQAHVAQSQPRRFNSGNSSNFQENSRSGDNGRSNGRGHNLRF